MEGLHIVGIEKQYKGDTAFSLKPVHLTIKEGEFFSLLGPSGCGKTTLLKLAAGLLKPDKGDIVLGGKTITALPSERRGFGMVFQQALLFPHMTVEENVAFGLKVQGVRKKERLQKAGEMLEKVGLKGYESRYPSALSGGQQQRVSLARALVIQPRLLLMDEPFSALDPELREEMRELVSAIHQELQVTIVFVTHDRDEAFQLSDRIGVMKEGALLQTGTPQQLYEHPNTPDVAIFLGARNVLEGEIRNGYFYSDDVSINVCTMQSTENKAGWLVMRPEIFQPVREKESGFDNGEYSTYLHGTVKQAVFKQGFYHIKVQVQSKLFDAVYYAKESFPIRAGEEIRLYYDAQKFFFIS